MESDVQFREGDVLVNKYRLERLLGTGGMGVVYEATQLELDRRVAIKLLRPDSGNTEAIAARILVEARATARLHNPHVAKLLDVGRLDSNVPFLVMEYLQGRNLQDLLLTDGPCNTGLAIKYVLEVCEALAEAHRAGIIHRDLKPANLFLTQDTYGQPCIKVLDFGISKLLEPGAAQNVALTDSRALVGSPAYMSPEQMRSARDVDHRTDIWSLGAVLFELLAGRAVWTGQSLSELCAQVSRDECPTLDETCPGVARELSAVVTRCLQKDPAARYQDVADLALALKPFARPEDRSTVDRVLQLAGRITQAALQTTRAPDVAPTASESSTSRTLEASVVTASKSRRSLRRGSLTISIALLTIGVLGLLWLRPARLVAPATPSSNSLGNASTRPINSLPLVSNPPISSSSRSVSAPLASSPSRSAAASSASSRPSASVLSSARVPAMPIRTRSVRAAGAPPEGSAKSARPLVDPMSIRE